MKTFPMGGVHPEENKISTNAVIETMPVPEQVVVLMNQHLGAPATPVVAKGDQVKVGQLIGEAQTFMCANVHSPVSGTVLKVDSCKDAFGLAKPAVYIQVQGDEWMETIDRTPNIKRECELTPTEIVDKLKAMGIVGLGGATFPAHIKYAVPPGKKAEYLIINAVECEPYLTSDHRVMLEHAEEICIGVSILRKALGVPMAYIGIENNKPEPIAVMTAMAGKFEGITVEPLKVKYSMFYSGAYETYMHEELIPEVEKLYKGNGKRAIAGLSMGGYGTTLHALKYPEKFTYAYAMSPATSGDMKAFVDAQPDKSVFPGFTFEVGNQDTTVDNAGTKKLADYMTEKGLKVEWIERDGIHYWNFWQECLPKALARAGESFK